MKKIESFVNRYSLLKTLQFSLIPVGNTEKNFNEKLLLKEDIDRSEKYSIVKEYIDRYHKDFIDSVLSNIDLDKVDEYADIYFKIQKSDADKKYLEDIETLMRKEISQKLTNDKRYANMFKKEMIEEVLPSFLTDKREIEIVNSFKGFATYFNGFWNNRKNMYKSEKQSTCISYRCINDNLPKFLDNMKVFKKVINQLDKASLEELNNNFEGLCGTKINDVFSVDYFSFVLSQSGIDRYNDIIGGYTTSDSKKIQGLNEYINLYNQKASKETRIPKLKPLFKQILSDHETISFIPEKFNSDNEVLEAINHFYTDKDEKNICVCTAIEKIENLFSSFSNFNLNGIFVQNGLAVTDLSQNVFGKWSSIITAWNNVYDEQKMNKKPKDIESYEQKRNKEYKKTGSFSIMRLQELGNMSSEEELKIADYYQQSVSNAVESIKTNYLNVKNLICNPYNENKRLYKNNEAIGKIKDFLDSIKSLQSLIKPILGTGKEEEKDEFFYGEFLPYYAILQQIDLLYDKVRNYMTQKPYSKDKIKLNFDNPQFLGGWMTTKECDYSAQIFRDSNFYYIGILNKNTKSKYIRDLTSSAFNDNHDFEKMEYYQMASPSRNIPNLMYKDGKIVMIKGARETSGEHIGENLRLEEAKNTYLPKNINRIRQSRSFSTTSENFSKDDLNKYIEYYEGCIKDYYKNYPFKFYPTEQYSSFKHFADHVASMAYQVKFVGISRDFINSKIDSGELYLFKIYNKDFSLYAKGTPNLHTLYFKMLFDERNLSNVVFQLSGEAEMFYRMASINKNDTTIHAANHAIKNKNPHTDKKESTFEYDIIKDRRYTQRQFSLHFPITLNFKAEGVKNCNEEVRKALKNSSDNYVIGIDRGERNLIYISVINSRGEIIEQQSLNEIVNIYNKKEHTIDYHKILDKKEMERKSARQNWTSVEGIKELKNGYISQVVHKICELVEKYDAVIAMEDLNSGFKNSRAKVEKQVYQKFEKMLIDKLNFFADKKKSPEENGGLLRAYQLTNAFESFKKMGIQNGFIFYIPAWNTSKIDPVTGFIDLLHPRYTSVESSKSFIEKFEKIQYNSKENLFEFTFDYHNFPRGNMDYRDRWTVCSNADRIRVFRNEKKNNEFDFERVFLTEKFINLFDSYDIDFNSSKLKDTILHQTDKAFFEELMRTISLMLQMRNSVTGTDEDYLISPVRDSEGNFFDSRNYTNSSKLPCDADANGAYNIARKVLWAIEVFKKTPDDELKKAKISISNKEWLEYIQEKV